MTAQRHQLVSRLLVCAGTIEILWSCRGPTYVASASLDTPTGLDAQDNPSNSGECTLRCVDDEDCALLYTAADGKQRRQRYPLMVCQTGWCRDMPKALVTAQLGAAASRKCITRADCCRNRELSDAECAYLKECRDGVCGEPQSCSVQTCRGDLRFSPYSRAECADGKCIFPCASDADCTHFPNNDVAFRHSDTCWAGQCVHRCTEENCDRDEKAQLHPRGMGCAPTVAKEGRSW